MDDLSPDMIESLDDLKENGAIQRVGFQEEVLQFLQVVILMRMIGLL